MSQENTSPSRTALVVDLLKTYRLAVYAVLAGVIWIIYSSHLIPNLGLDNTKKVALTAALGGFALGYKLFAPTIIDMLYTEDVVWIEELNPIQLETQYKKWKIPRARLPEITWVKTPDKVNSILGDVYIVEHFNRANLTATGVDRGSLQGRELIIYEEKVREIRQELEHEANEGTILKVRARSIIRQAVRDIVMEIFSVIETEGIFGGDNISRIIDRAVDSLDIDEYVETVDDGEQEGDLEELPSQMSDIAETPSHEQGATELGEKGDGQ